MIRAAINPGTAAAEVIRMSIHVGTHIDALCHISERQNSAGEVDSAGEPRLYAGDGETVAASECVTSAGQNHLSAEQMPPIVMRSVMVDVAAYKGVETLPPAYGIGADDIRGALEKQGSRISENTAVLVRTGLVSSAARWRPGLSRCADGLESGRGRVPGLAGHDSSWGG